MVPSLWQALMLVSDSARAGIVSQLTWKSYYRRGRPVRIELTYRINSLLKNLVFQVFFVLSFEFLLSCKGVVLIFLSTEPARRSYVSRSGHQVSQSAQVVGSSGEDKQPPYLLDSSQLHFS